MTQSKTSNSFYASLPKIDRIDSVDHMRGFIFLLMAVDHALHAYAANWGKYAFFRDYDRSYIFDGLYLFNQAAIMPVLFFTFGAYILPKLNAYGIKAFWKDKFVKYIIPFMIGVPLVVPLLSFPKYSEFTDPSISYGDYLQTVFFPHALQAGPYWVMYALTAFTVLLLLINKLIPKLVPTLSRFIQNAFHQPVKNIALFGLVSIVIYGLSDLRYGAPWWVGFKEILPDYLYGQLFSLQGSKYLMNFVYFVMGAAFMESKVWKSPDFRDVWIGFTSKRYFWLVCTLTFGALYVTYAHLYFHDGAYDYTMYKIIRVGGGTWDAYVDAFSHLTDKAPAVLLRTTLLAILVMMQVLTLLAFFGQNRDTSSRSFAFWSSAAACCWGIFIIHDPIMIWLQFSLISVHVDPILKILIVSLGGILPAWLITKGLLKTPYIKRVFELD